MICHRWAPQLSPGSKQCQQLKLMGTVFFWQRKWEKNLCSLKNVKIIPIFLYSLCPEGKLSCGNCTVIVMELKFWENPYIWSEHRAKVPLGQGGNWWESWRKRPFMFWLVQAPGLPLSYTYSDPKQHSKAFENWTNLNHWTWHSLTVSVMHWAVHVWGRSNIAWQSLCKLNWHWDHSPQKMEQKLHSEPIWVDCSNKQKSTLSRTF